MIKSLIQKQEKGLVVLEVYCKSASSMYDRFFEVDKYINVMQLFCLDLLHIHLNICKRH